MRKIGLIVGSLRKESYNRKVANTVIELLGEDYKGEIIEIKDLPLYNEDIDDGNPLESYKVFRNKIKEMDGIIFFTPEYNRSVSSAIKNAVDVGSRPYGENAWNNKPAGVISASISPMGGLMANQTLRHSLVPINMPVLQKPEMYLGSMADCFTQEGKMVDETKEYINSFVTAYKSHVELYLNNK